MQLFLRIFRVNVLWNKCFGKTSCNVSNDFGFSNVSEEAIKKILLRLDTSKAAGMGQIPAKFLRDGAEALALPLGNIINLSIKLSTFPEECKIATLKLIFKTGARTDPTTDLFHFCH